MGSQWRWTGDVPKRRQTLCRDRQSHRRLTLPTRRRKSAAQFSIPDTDRRYRHRGESPNLTPDARKNLNKWLTDPAFAKWRSAVEALLAAPSAAELNDAFGADIGFGTGGLRGGADPGRGG